jgi:hypothetical protein
MGILDKLRGKKVAKDKKATESKKVTKSKKVAETVAKPMTNLEKLCGEDKETYEALHDVIILNPKKIGVSMKAAYENAKKNEKDKDDTKARMWYRIAGGLAIYEGNAKKAAEFITECERIMPSEKFLFLKDPEKAVAKAQEYYQKYLPSQEVKTKQ